MTGIPQRIKSERNYKFNRMFDTPPHSVLYLGIYYRNTRPVFPMFGLTNENTILHKTLEHRKPTKPAKEMLDPFFLRQKRKE